MMTQLLKVTSITFALVLFLSMNATAAVKPSPDKCVSLLKAGNARFVAGESKHPNTTAARLAQAGRDNQGDHAFATVITCSDSRVPVERLFDVGVMDVFVIRVAGNVLDVDEVGSVEYGIAHVKTPVFVILGHTQCGAVTAVTHAVHGKGPALERNIPPLVDNIEPAVHRAMSRNGYVQGDAIIPYAIEENVYQGAEDLFLQSPTARNMVNNGTLKVIGAVYDVATGNIKWLPEAKITQVLAAVEANPDRAMNAMAGSVHGEKHATQDAHGESADAKAAVAGIISKLTNHQTTTDRFQKEVSSAGMRGLAFNLLVVAVIAICVGLVIFFARSKDQYGATHLRKSLGARLVAGFSVMIVILTFSSVFSLNSMNKMGKELSEIAERLIPMNNVTTTIEVHHLEQAIELERAFRFGMEEGEHAAENFKESSESFKQLSHQVDQEITKALALLEEIPATSKGAAEEFEDLGNKLLAINNHHHSFGQVSEKVFEMIREGHHAQARILEEYVGEIEAELDDEIETLQEELQKRTAERTHSAEQNEKRAANFILILALFSIVLSLSIAIILTRSIVGPINRVISGMQTASEQVANASGQVSSASQQLAEGASEQASSLEETAASLEMMSSAAKDSASNTQQANSRSQGVKNQAERGQSAMTGLCEAMEKIKTSSDETAKIVKNIDEIAFQTNLLALNAAVEAARAGDAGKGFAVVAEEVRNLAQRSAEAAKGTAELIDGSQENSDLGIKATEEVATILSEVVEGVSQVSGLVTEVSSAAEEQARSISEINTAVSQLDSITQSNAAGAEESASAAQEMSAQASEMNSLVKDLVQIVNGDASAGIQNTPYASAESRAHQGPLTREPQPARSKTATQSYVPSTGHGQDASRVQRMDKVIPLDDDCLVDL